MNMIKYQQYKYKVDQVSPESCLNFCSLGDANPGEAL